MKPIVTPRLRLRPLEGRDAAALSGYRSDPEVAHFQSWQPPYSEAQALRLIEEMHGRSLSDEGWTQVAVADLKTDELLGDIGFRRFEPRQAELGFTLSRAHQGQGLMREALEALISEVFGTLNLHRIAANTDARNLASQKLLTRLRFRLEGVLVQSWWENESWYDEHLYALLHSDWHAK